VVQHIWEGGTGTVRSFVVTACLVSEDKPGVLRSVIAPLIEVGADLQVVMGHHHPRDEN